MNVAIRPYGMNGIWASSAGFATLVPGFHEQGREPSSPRAPETLHGLAAPRHSILGCGFGTDWRRVIPFERDSPEDSALLGLLTSAAAAAAGAAAKKGIATERPNEAGNAIEPFVESALRAVGLAASRPQCRSGSSRSSGYPDLETTDRRGRTVYLDCKTYSRETRNQTLRSFYLSLSDDPKITRDAMHLILGVELRKTSQQGRNVFVPEKWSLWTLDTLSLQI